VVAGMLRGVHANGCWTWLMLHELGHNFDPFGWRFSRQPSSSASAGNEFMANLLASYVICQRNVVLIMGAGINQRRVTNLTDLQNYFRRFHTNAMNSRQFNADAMLYMFLRIAYNQPHGFNTGIGWQPFRNTFRDIERMRANGTLPSNNDMALLNLLLDGLRRHSGVNVARYLLSPAERQLIEGYFRNGTININ